MSPCPATLVSSTHPLAFPRRQHKSQTSNSQSSIDASTKQQIESLKKGVEKNRAVVVDKILDRVVRCEPKMHRNLKKIEA
jgi:V-type H+-transporting ATPase subunit G